MFSEAFELAITFVLKWEGGYVNDPHDPGGETKFGISKRAYPNLDIKHLTLEQAKEIYFEDYWLKAKCDKIESLSQRLAFAHFNFSVNAGIRRAVKTLQEAIKRQQPEIIVDGIFGPKTYASLESSNVQFVYDTYFNVITKFYTNLVAKRISLRKFYRGWMNRVVDAYEYGLSTFEN